MTLSGTIRLASVASFVVAAALTTPAGAQTVAPRADKPSPDAASVPASNDKKDEQGVGEIVVTAQKREQNLQKVSASVQALNGTALAKAGINDVSRLEQLAPGIVFAKGGNDAKIALRGEKAEYQLVLNKAELVASRAKMVRGVVISSTTIPASQWLAEVRAEVQALAEQAGSASDTLHDFL